MPKDPSYPQGVARPAFITRWLDYQLRRDPLLKLDLEDLFDTFARKLDIPTPELHATIAEEIAAFDRFTADHPPSPSEDKPRRQILRAGRLPPKQLPLPHTTKDPHAKKTHPL